jgi:site-specific DNA-methyltransferase (adenine-specific)
MQYKLHTGDNREVLKSMPDNCVDSIVTDPPYELGFMNKKWDSSGISYDQGLWSECLRVLKPGGYLLAFGGTRTFHRLAVAIEDSGFELRDTIMWLYSSGFPKSLDVSKNLDKLAGVEDLRPDDGPNPSRRPSAYTWSSGNGHTAMRPDRKTSAYSDEAKLWEGWGTALKPAYEPIIVARKPLDGTVVNNLLKWGVGVININGCRINYASEADKKLGQSSRPSTSKGMSYYSESYSDSFDRTDRSSINGRWPANITFDETAAALLDEQSGISRSSQRVGKRSGKDSGTFGEFSGQDNVVMGHSDSGGASRFFYVSKTSLKEREAGLDHLPLTRESDCQKDDGVGGDNPRNRTNTARRNHHPTIKPIELMRYLVRLVTPKGCVVLDPFMGSGSTGCACALEGMDFIGIDIDPSYVIIAEARIKHWQA